MQVLSWLIEIAREIIMQRTLELNDLPPELHSLILGFLKNDTMSQVAMSHTNCYWRDLARNELMTRRNEASLQEKLLDMENIRFTTVQSALKNLDKRTRYSSALALVLFELMGIAAGPILVNIFEADLTDDAVDAVVYVSAAILSGIATAITLPVLLGVLLVTYVGIAQLVEKHQSKKHDKRSKFTFFNEPSIAKTPDLESGEREAMLGETSEPEKSNYRSINSIIK